MEGGGGVTLAGKDARANQQGGSRRLAISYGRTLGCNGSVALFNGHGCVIFEVGVVHDTLGCDALRVENGAEGAPLPLGPPQVLPGALTCLPGQ